MPRQSSKPTAKRRASPVDALSPDAVAAWLRQILARNLARNGHRVAVLDQEVSQARERAAAPLGAGPLVVEQGAHAAGRALDGGALAGAQAIWAWADLLNGIMAIPNLIALVVLGGEIGKMVGRGGVR